MEAPSCFLPSPSPAMNFKMGRFDPRVDRAMPGPDSESRGGLMWLGALGPKSKGMVAPALASPTEPGPDASPVSVPGGGTCPAQTHTARTEGLEPALVTPSVGALERPVCSDGSSWRIPAEKTLSSGGIESSFRSGKKPQLITSVK